MKKAIKRFSAATIALVMAAGTVPANLDGMFGAAQTSITAYAYDAEKVLLSVNTFYGEGELAYSLDGSEPVFDEQDPVKTISVNQDKGTEVKLSARASTGYLFVCWAYADERDNALISFDPTITVTLEEATDLIAIFDVDAQRYPLRVNTRGSGQIAVNDYGGEPEFDDKYPYTSAYYNVVEGRTVKVGAKADEDYKFVHWLNEDTDEIYSTEPFISVEVTKALSLIAVFEYDNHAMPEKAVISGVRSDSYGSLTAGWAKDENADGYEILLWNSRRMGFRTSVSRFDADSSETEATIEGLNPNGRYYVKIRAYKLVDGERVYGKYSDTSSVTVKGYGSGFGYSSLWGFGHSMNPFARSNYWGCGYGYSFGRPYLVSTSYRPMMSPFYFFRF